eukprot:6176357-Pyramimonas_sp.AAC.1
MSRAEWQGLNTLLTYGGRKKGPSPASDTVPLMTDEGVAPPTAIERAQQPPRVLTSHSEVTDSMQQHFCQVERGHRLTLPDMINEYNGLPNIVDPEGASLTYIPTLYDLQHQMRSYRRGKACLLYTSDAADDTPCVAL